MSDATDNRPDPCTLLASIEAMFAHLAERISQRDQGDHTDPGHQADHHTDTEDLPHE